MFPLYFKLFNQIVKQGDGALIEMMGDYCFKIIYNYPTDVFTFFKDNTEYLDKYALIIGYEFYFKEQGTSGLPMTYSDFYSYLRGKLNKKDKMIKQTLNEFDGKVKEVIRNMN